MPVSAAKMAEDPEKFLKVNLCGKTYELSKRSLVQARVRTQPLTYLEYFAELSHEERLALAHDFCPDRKSYFFWRSPEVFESLLCHYGSAVNRHIHCPTNVCPDRFREELEFWKIEAESVAPCCRPKLQSMEDKIGKLQKHWENTQSVEVDETISLQVPILMANGGQRTSNRHAESDCKGGRMKKEEGRELEEFSKVLLGKQRRVMWKVLEIPSSSLAAKIFGTVSVIFVLTSVISLIIGSLASCQKEDGEPVAVLTYIESACVAWFSFEYLTRFLVAANKWKYVKKPINLIDLVSVLPFYFELGLIVADVNTAKLQNIKGALLVMRILRVLRVARLFRLARYSGGMMSFGETLTASKNEIGMLLMFLSTTVILFSTTVYFMEKEAKETPFTSIPATFWWCVVTMTTVG